MDFDVRVEGGTPDTVPAMQIAIQFCDKCVHYDGRRATQSIVITLQFTSLSLIFHLINKSFRILFPRDIQLPEIYNYSLPRSHLGILLHFHFIHIVKCTVRETL